VLCCSFQDGVFVQVGAWSQKAGLEFTAPIIWPGMNTEERPSEEVPRRLIELSGGLAGGAYAVTVSRTLPLRFASLRF
jgi:hypothetical protein